MDDENATLEQAITKIQRLRLAQKIIKEQEKKLAQLEKEVQELNEKLSQNDKNGSNFVENQKNIELPQREKENDLQAKLDDLTRKLDENINIFSSLLSSSQPKYLQEMLNQVAEMQTLLVKSPSLNALNADKTLKRFDSFCKTQNLSIQRT